jgi:hypothetical protein
MTKPLSVWERIKFFLGIPRYAQATCFKCGYRGQVIDLGDSDFVCHRCWVNWRPQ